jgi:hypothetical protein
LCWVSKPITSNEGALDFFCITKSHLGRPRFVGHANLNARQRIGATNGYSKGPDEFENDLIALMQRFKSFNLQRLLIWSARPGLCPNCTRFGISSPQAANVCNWPFATFQTQAPNGRSWNNSRQTSYQSLNGSVANDPSRTWLPR